MRKNRKNTKKCLLGKRNMKTSALQAESENKAPLKPNDSGTQKAFFCVFPKYYLSASLTLEAAFVVPLFVFFMVMLISIVDIYRVQSLVKTSIHQSALELGMYAYGVESNTNLSNSVVSDVACQIYAQSQLPEFPTWIAISMHESSYKNDYIKIKADIIYRFPVTLIPASMFLTNTLSQVRAWTGRDISQKDAQMMNSNKEMVYVTQYESVYHTSSSCTHLDLSVNQCSRISIDNRRNVYGEKYHLCEKCGDASEMNNYTYVYYTEKGNRYHVDVACSGIKRMVMLIDKSNITDMDLCERCESRGTS